MATQNETRLLDIIDRLVTVLDKVVEKFGPLEDDPLAGFVPDDAAETDDIANRYFLAPDEETHPELKLQLDAMPTSRGDAVYDYPIGKQAKLIQQFLKYHETVDDGRENIAAYRMICSQINERFDLDLMVAPARGPHDIIAIIDRPSKSVFFLAKRISSEDWEEAFDNVKLDLPVDIETMAQADRTGDQK